MLLFEFQNLPNRLVLHLYIGPGPDEVRREVFEVARSVGPPFRLSGKSLYKKWNSLYQREFLNAAARADANAEELEEPVKKAWTAFVANDLPLLRSAVVEELGELAQHEVRANGSRDLSGDGASVPGT